MTVAVAALAAAAWRLQHSRSRRETVDTSPPPTTSSRTQPRPPPTDEPVENVSAQCMLIAFGVARFDYQILGEHAAVLERVDETVASSVHERDYFPRRPMLLPRLMQMLNDDESSRNELSRLILEDPALTSGVLKLANSAFYRYTPEPIETLQRAVVLLGTDGLRSLMATAILQPVFRLPKGFFDNFAPFTWEQAQRTARAAETCAKLERGADPFVAQLLGLLGGLARLVIFRLTLDRYREQPNVLPRAEVFIRAMQKHNASVAHLIAASWELSDVSLAALDEQTQRIAPQDMSPLGRAIHFGEVAGALAVLHRAGAYSVDGAHALLMQQGLSREAAHTVWHAAAGSM